MEQVRRLVFIKLFTNLVRDDLKKANKKTEHYTINERMKQFSI